MKRQRRDLGKGVGLLQIISLWSLLALRLGYPSPLQWMMNGSLVTSVSLLGIQLWEEAEQMSFAWWVHWEREVRNCWTCCREYIVCKSENRKKTQSAGACNAPWEAKKRLGTQEQCKQLRQGWRFQHAACQVNVWLCIIGWLLFLQKDEQPSQERWVSRYF